MCTPRSKENIDFNLTKKEVVITSKRCIQNVNSLLSCAKLLGDNDDTRQYAAGLYLYAVEEYGKAQLLKQLLKQTGGKIPGWIFGRGDSRISNAHNAKINEGFKNLPDECQILSVGVKMEINTNEKTQTFKIGRKQKVSPLGFATGNFVDTSSGSRVELDFKTAFFYIDWDDENRIPSSRIAVEKTQLYKIIRLFEEKIVRVRWDSDPRHFNPIIDWLRARRSAWLSYEPTKVVCSGCVI